MIVIVSGTNKAEWTYEDPRTDDPIHLKGTYTQADGSVSEWECVGTAENPSACDVVVVGGW